jgi:hypothetical protein
MTSSRHPEIGADAAAAVAERGLAAWREAKAAWLVAAAEFAKDQPHTPQLPPRDHL